MNKLGTALFGAWMVLAIISFIAAFFITIPYIKWVGIVFGVENILIILSWIITLIQAKIAKKNVPTEEEIAEMMKAMEIENKPKKRGRPKKENE